MAEDFRDAMKSSAAYRARAHLINTPLQRGDERYDKIVTASAVFTADRKTAESGLESRDGG